MLLGQVLIIKVSCRISSASTGMVLMKKVFVITVQFILLHPYGLTYLKIRFRSGSGRPGSKRVRHWKKTHDLTLTAFWPSSNRTEKPGHMGSGQGSTRVRQVQTRTAATLMWLLLAMTSAWTRHFFPSPWLWTRNYCSGWTISLPCALVMGLPCMDRDTVTVSDQTIE